MIAGHVRAFRRAPTEERCAHRADGLSQLILMETQVMFGTTRRFGLALVVMGALLMAGGVSTAAAAADAKTLKNPVKTTPESIAAGQATFKKYCAFCHNTDASGNGP